ncbi:retrovirus-related pol polyprotein from transposon TNT 1-94 [Tanacetum coccineum]
MYGSEVTKHVTYSRLMIDFDKLEAKEGESLEYVYERLLTLVNVMDSNDVRPTKVFINTKFFNSLQPDWRKYVTLTRQNKNLSDLKYDALYDDLLQFEPYVQAYKENLYTPNNHLCTSSNTRNQAVIQDGRIDIQTKNAGYGGNVQKSDESNQIVQRVPQIESNPGRTNVQCYNCNARGHYACDCPKPKVCDAKYFREQMLLAMKDEAGGTLNDEENDFMLDNSFGDETLKELTAAVIMMARIQPSDDNAETEPKYDAETVSEVNTSHIDLISSMISKGVHEHTNFGKLKTVINIYDDDQIDCNIIFDDPYVENNGGTDEHNSNAHDQSFDIQSLVYNVQREAKNQQRLNNELKKQKELLQKELETCKERVKTLEFKLVQCSKYKKTCDDLEREIRADKDTIERILKEKDKIESDFFKIENEKVIIQHET